MNRDDTHFDDTLREFLRHRAADTAAVRDASAMSAAIGVRLPGQGRMRDGAFAGRLILAATLTVLLLLAAATFLVGSQRPPVPPSSLGNGYIAYATQSGLSSAYLVRPGEAPRQIIPSETSVGNTVVCPASLPEWNHARRRHARREHRRPVDRRAWGSSATAVDWVLAPARRPIARPGHRTARQSPTLMARRSRSIPSWASHCGSRTGRRRAGPTPLHLPTRTARFSGRRTVRQSPSPARPGPGSWPSTGPRLASSTNPQRTQSAGRRTAPDSSYGPLTVPS